MVLISLHYMLLFSNNLPRANTLCKNLHSIVCEIAILLKLTLFCFMYIYCHMPRKETMMTCFNKLRTDYLP